MFAIKKINTKQVSFFFLILTVFIIPLSHSLKSIFLNLAILAILAQPDMRARLREVLGKPWCQATLIFFALVLLNCLQGDADWHGKLSYIHKYFKLLYLPILAIAFQDRRMRSMAIHVFLLAMLITLLLSLMKVMGWVMINQPDDPGAIFLNHIDTGYFMAFSAYVSAMYALESRRWSRIAYGALAILFSYHTLFLNTGRTGYFVFVILLALFVLKCITLRKIPVFLLLFLPVLFFAGSQSVTLKQRIHHAVQDAQDYSSGNKNTSLGYRLQFSRYSEILFLARPILGWGTAGFAHQFHQDQPIPAWGKDLSDPHNQYWLVMVDYGIIGLVLLLYFFFTMAYACRNSKELLPMMTGLFISFFAANFADSFLLLSGTGYFFIMFAAMGLGASLAGKPVLATVRESRLQELTC